MAAVIARVVTLPCVLLARGLALVPKCLAGTGKAIGKCCGGAAKGASKGVRKLGKSAKGKGKSGRSRGRSGKKKSNKKNEGVEDYAELLQT